MQQALEKATREHGGTVVLSNLGLPIAPSTPEVLQLAHNVISANANCVVAIIGLAYPLQLDLNELGHPMPVIQPGTASPAVTQQFGTKLNGMVYIAPNASLYASKDPGVQQFMATMKKEGFTSTDDLYSPYAADGFIDGAMVVHALQITTPPYTTAKLLASLAGMSGFTANSMMEPLQYPSYQHNGTSVCLSFSIVENGHWVAYPDTANPFACGSEIATPS
jgi:hypothetical protein